jgi:hypothetical protein
MTTANAENALVTHLIGSVPDFNRSLSKGATLGVLTFVIFEGISLINPNVPRVPAPWLIAFSIWIAQLVLLFKISRFLKRPRIEDFFFVTGMNYDQRKKIAMRSYGAVHEAILPFTVVSVLIAITLEFTIVKERSFINIGIVPLAFCALTLLFYKIGTVILDKGLIKISLRDIRNTGLSSFFNMKIFVLFAKMILTISKVITSVSPRSIRPLTIRNVLYLLRSAPLQLSLLIVTAPVLLTLFLLLIGNPQSPFVLFFPILTVFLLNYFYAGLLLEASLKFKECPYYEYSPKRLLFSHLFTTALFALPYIFIYICIINKNILSLSGLMRTVTFFTSLGATLLVSSRAVLHFERKDSDSVTDWLLFIIGIAPGLFIPNFGWIFALLISGVFLLLEWETFFQKKIISG